MKHDIYFLFSILSLVIIAPFGAINPIIALAAVGIAGVFFFVWYLKEMKAQEKENEILDSLSVDLQPEIPCKTRSYQL